MKILDERVVRRAKSRDVDVLVYAPHFTRLSEIRVAAERYSDDELLVVPAREVFTGSWRNRRHLLVIGLSDPVPDFISLDAALDEFDRQEAAVLVPHPTFLNVSMSRADIAASLDDIDAVEIYNAKCQPRRNQQGQYIARDFHLPPFGSSYAHLHRTVGEAWTEFEGEIESADDLAEALRNGRNRRVFHKAGPKHRIRSAIEFSHLGFENSWGKIDRLLLSGMEPTHPDHIAYEGRFDDASVY